MFFRASTSSGSLPLVCLVLLLWPHFLPGSTSIGGETAPLCIKSAEKEQGLLQRFWTHFNDVLNRINFVIYLTAVFVLLNGHLLIALHEP